VRCTSILVCLAVAACCLLLLSSCEKQASDVVITPSPIKLLPPEPPAQMELPAEYQVKIIPAVEAYELPEDLATLNNYSKISELTSDHKEQLTRNGFVVIPDNNEQIFMLYEEYNWGADEEESPLPNFITVDSVLHLYHIFFDFSLRSVEETKLYDAAVKLTDLCLAKAQEQYESAPEGLKDAALRNVAYFAVARSLLSGPWSAPEGIPDEATSLVNEELGKIEAHAQRLPSPILERTVHYTQFNPRGHYTRSETLQKYFRGMMWYGLVGFELDKPKEKPELIRRHQQQALLITKLIGDSEEIQELWQTIYEPSNFFVGGADDLTYEQYQPIMAEVFGDSPSLEDLADRDKVGAFISTAQAKLPEPGIAPAFLEANDEGKLEDIAATPQGRQFRFMGQRFVPDSHAMQELVFPKVGTETKPRHWPSGLDVMAVLGSQRARAILLDVYDQGQYADYESQLDKLIAEFAAEPVSKWLSNLYWGWLYSFKPLLTEKGEGYPTFMRSEAWLDKELNTSLGSWAELRHDTILYGKQSGAEMGGPPFIPVKGYVEPYPEVYARLAYLAHMSKSGLEQRGILPETLAEKYDDMHDLLMFLKNCSEKLLTNQALTEEEYERIQAYGGELERLMLSVVESTSEYGVTRWFEITNEADRYMACIADVHTSFDKVLEEAVGYAYPIYVIVPDPDGGLQVARGGVFSYHEFEWPASDRLTDEKWIEMLNDGTAPAHPEWTESFMASEPMPPEEWEE